MKLEIQMLKDGRYYYGEKVLKRSHTLEHTAVTWHTGLDWIELHTLYIPILWKRGMQCAYIKKINSKLPTAF